MRFPSRSASRIRRFFALTGLSLSSLGGCTDPAFRDLPDCDGAACDDAGDLRDSGASDADADPEIDETIDAKSDASTPWGADMVGQYGIRVRFYSLSSADGSRFDHEIIMLARIARDGATGRVDMTTQRCKDEGHTISKSLPGAKQTFSWPHAADLPDEHFELEFDGNAFHTVADPRAIGYVEKQPEGCVTGNTLPARPDQVWQKNCTCRNDPLPVFADDCRVTDPDRDKSPGVTTLQEGIIVDGTNFVRAQDRCRIVNGTIAKDGKHRANYIEDYDYRELQCAGGNCLQIPVTACPVGLNPVEFQRLGALPNPNGGAWDCPSLVAGSTSGALFSSEPVHFPEACDAP